MPVLAQGNRQVTKAAVEWYGPDRAGFLGPFTDPPSYLNGEYPGDYGAHPALTPPCLCSARAAHAFTLPLLSTARACKSLPLLLFYLVLL